MNHVILSGRLCADPETRYTQGANPVAVARYRLAVNRYKSEEADFINCTALEDLVIEGVIGNNGFSVQWSTKLSHDSLMSIMNALQDKLGKTQKLSGRSFSSRTMDAAAHFFARA